MFEVIKSFILFYLNKVIQVKILSTKCVCVCKMFMVLGKVRNREGSLKKD